MNSQELKSLDEVLYFLDEYNSEEEEQIEKGLETQAQRKARLEKEKKEKEEKEIQDAINSPDHYIQTEDEKQYDKWEKER